MRWIFAVIGLVAIFLTAPNTSAQGLLLAESDSHVLVSENSAREKLILGYVVSAAENTLQDNIRVYGALSGVNVYDSSGGLSFSVSGVENGWSLIEYSLRGTLQVGDRSDVTVEFTKAVENIDGNRVYKLRYKWTIIPTSYQIITRLPAGASLVSTTENPSELYTENSSLYLRYSGALRDSFNTHIVFKLEASPAVENQQVVGGPGGQVEGDKTPLYVALVAAAVASVFAVWAFLRIRAKKPPVKALETAPEVVLKGAEKAVAPKTMSKEDIEKILKILSDHERKILEELIKEDGLTQATLCGRTGIPKATMSRVLQKLEDKGLVRRVGYGMSKKVMLTGLAKRWKG
jgi:uncharacterized membrane protein